MAVKLVVAVTDRDWFDHLSQRGDLAEVNFWAPSGTTFKALEPGELFLFKLHAPPPAYGSSRHRFAGRGLQGGEGWTRTLGRAWARRSAPTTLAQAGPRPSADGGCRRAASRTRC